jgi:hypothetical protein
VRAPKQKRTAALTSVSDLVKTFDRHRQLTLSPQLVRFTRLGSVTESESVTKPEASGRPSVASNFFYRVPIKVKMPLGSIKQVVSELGQAAKDVVGSGLAPGPTGQSLTGSRNSLSAVQEKTETTLVDLSDNTVGNETETAGNGTSLDWTEDDATTLLHTENGATDDLPHHLQLHDQVPFTPVFTEEEAAASVGMGSARQSPRSLGESQAAPPGNFLATMEFSVSTPTTVKARLPQLQARRQLPFSGTTGTPKRKKPSSSTKKGARSAGASLAEDSTSSGDERMATSEVATSGKIKGGKGTRDPLAELDALEEQLKTMQMDLLNRQLETMEVIACVKTDIMQLHNRVQHHQEAHINLKGVVGHTATRVTNTETAISDIHVRLSEVDRKQEEAQRALAALKAMPSLTAGAERSQGGQAFSHTSAFFLGGVPQLRTLLELPQQADPMEVVSAVMRDVRMYCAVDRIFLADGQATSRAHTRAVVIYMCTPFHKREAMIKLKKFLAHWQVQDATVRDCFPTEVMERARHLASYGAHLRRTEDNVRRYQVVNRRGEPVLQVAGSNGRYADHEVDEVALKALIAGQADNRPQREADRGKTGPRHVAKNRRKNTSKKSSGRSSPMATDEDSTLSSAIPTSSVNAVPQGQFRTTTNLASANLSRRDRSSESEQTREPARTTKPSIAALEQPRPLHQPQQPPQQPPMQRQRQPQQEGPLPPHQPQLLQPHQQRQDGRALAVPQPGNGPRQVAPPFGMANTAPHGQHWYPATPAHQGSVYHPSEYAPSAHGGPHYVPYDAQPMTHGGHPGYVVGHYGPAPIRFTASQPQPAGYFSDWSRIPVGGQRC